MPRSMRTSSMGSGKGSYGSGSKSAPAGAGAKKQPTGGGKPIASKKKG